MRPDPKFGWHIYWIAPALYIGDKVGRPITKYKRWKAERAWQKHWDEGEADPEIRRMRKLAGVTAEASRAKALRSYNDRTSGLWLLQHMLTRR